MRATALFCFAALGAAVPLPLLGHAGAAPGGDLVLDTPGPVRTQCEAGSTDGACLPKPADADPAQPPPPKMPPGAEMGAPRSSAPDADIRSLMLYEIDAVGLSSDPDTPVVPADILTWTEPVE